MVRQLPESDLTPKKEVELVKPNWWGKTISWLLASGRAERTFVRLHLNATRSFIEHFAKVS